MVFLSVFNRERISDFIDRNLITSLPMRDTIEKLQQESIDKIIDLFQNWENSEVVKLNPSGNIRRGIFHKAEFIPFLYKPYKKAHRYLKDRHIG
jgi:hypothetical protein